MAKKLKRYNVKPDKKITELSRKRTFSMEEKIEIIERFKKTGEKIVGNTVFEGYPVGRWAIQIRSLVKRMNNMNGKIKIKFTEEQLNRLEKLGILERQIDTTIDEKIDYLIEWVKKYAKATIVPTVNDEVLREYATTDEEFEKIKEGYEKAKRYYEYVKVRKSKSKLKDSRIEKCKEGNIGSVFGYSKTIEEFAKMTGKTEKESYYVIMNYKTIDKFIDLYRKKMLNEKDLKLTSSMLRNVIDIDLTGNTGYDKLYRDILQKEETDTKLDFYSSKKLKEVLEILLKEREKKIIEERYGLKSDGIQKSFQSIGNEIGMLRESVRQLNVKILKRIHFYCKKTKEVSCNLNCILTDEEKKLPIFSYYLLYDNNLQNLFENLENNLYRSNLIFCNTPYSKDVVNVNISKVFELIKYMDKILVERGEKSLNLHLGGNDRQEILNIQIEELNFLPTIIFNFKRIGINTLGDVIRLKLTRKDLMEMENVGKYRCNEIIKKFREYGIVLEEDKISDETLENDKKISKQEQLNEILEKQELISEIIKNQELINEIMEKQDIINKEKNEV